MTSPPLFTRVDHVVIAVRDLEAGARAYGAMLGVEPSWRGTHPAYGTENVIFGLANSYVELLALGPGAAAHPVAVALEAYLAKRPEGPFALALATPDAARTADALRARGLTTSAVSVGEAVSRTGTRRRWRSFTIPRADTRGVNLIVIEHEQADALARAPVVGSAATAASAVDHVVIFSDDIASAVALWRERLGIPERWRREIPERGTINLGLRLGGVTLELVAPLGGAAGERGERLWGCAYVVADCGGAVQRLRRAEVPVTDARPGLAPATRVATVRWPDRVPTLLIEHTDRQSRPAAP